MHLTASIEANLVRQAWPLVNVYEYEFDSALVGTDDDESNYPPPSLDGIEVEVLQ